MTPAQPKHFPSTGGKSYQLGRITLCFKTGAAETGGAYTLCEAIEPPESGAGLHRHPNYDETFVICAGRYDFRLGEQQLTLGPGDTVFVPRGTAHAFKCLGPETGRQLIISSPGGIFDAFIEEVAAATVDSGDPNNPAPAVDFRGIAAKHGMEFL